MLDIIELSIFDKGSDQMASQNEIPVKIHVETVHQQDGQKEEYTEDFDGHLIEIGENVYLRYQEELPENEHAKVTFKIAGDQEIQLTRKLEHQKLHLTFKTGKRISARYQTPYGNIPVETLADRMGTILEGDPLAGKLEIDYRLYNGDSLLGNYKIRLQFTA